MTVRQAVELLHSWHALVPAEHKFSGTNHPWFELPTKELVEEERKVVEPVCSALVSRLNKEEGIA